MYNVLLFCTFASKLSNHRGFLRQLTTNTQSLTKSVYGFCQLFAAVFVSFFVGVGILVLVFVVGELCGIM